MVDPHHWGGGAYGASPLNGFLGGYFLPLGSPTDNNELIRDDRASSSVFMHHVNAAVHNAMPSPIPIMTTSSSEYNHQNKMPSPMPMMPSPMPMMASPMPMMASSNINGGTVQSQPGMSSGFAMSAAAAASVSPPPRPFPPEIVSKSLLLQHLCWDIYEGICETLRRNDLLIKAMETAGHEGRDTCEKYLAAVDDSPANNAENGKVYRPLYDKFLSYPHTHAQLETVSKLALLAPISDGKFTKEMLRVIDAERITWMLDEENVDVFFERASNIATQWLKHCFGDDSGGVTTSTTASVGVSTSPQAAAAAAAGGGGSDIIEDSNDTAKQAVTAVNALDVTGDETASSATGLSEEKGTCGGVSSTAGIATVARPPSPFTCNICHRPVSIHAFRFRCAECDEFDLCVTCFTAGKETDTHKKSHYYIPIGQNQFPLFNKEWSADEEILLLEGVGKYGFGNWQEVADLISPATPSNFKVKKRDVCEKRFFDFHMPLSNGTKPQVSELEDFQHKWDNDKNTEVQPLNYLSSQCLPVQYKHWSYYLKCVRNLVDDLSPMSHQKVSRRTFSDIHKVGYSVQFPKPILSSIITAPMSPPSKVTLVGYMPGRGDHETEYENDAELVIADLEFHESDTAQEKETKLRMLEWYNCILDSRSRRKQALIDLQLYDSKTASVDKSKSEQEKAIYETLKPLYRFCYPYYQNSRPHLFEDDPTAKSQVSPELTKVDIEELVGLLTDEKQLLSRLRLLSEWRAKGLRTLKEVQQYYAENRQDSQVVVGNTTTVKSPEKWTMSQLLKMPQAELLDSYELEFCAQSGLTPSLFQVVRNCLNQEINKATDADITRAKADRHFKEMMKQGLLTDEVAQNLVDFFMTAIVEKVYLPPSAFKGDTNREGSIPRRKRTREDEDTANLVPSSPLRGNPSTTLDNVSLASPTVGGPVTMPTGILPATSPSPMGTTDLGGPQKHLSAAGADAVKEEHEEEEGEIEETPSEEAAAAIAVNYEPPQLGGIYGGDIMPTS